MQGLSSRAHAFSVEALVGKPCKRRKVSEGPEANPAGDTGSHRSIFADQLARPSGAQQAAAPAVRRPEDSACEPQTRTLRSGSEDPDPDQDQDQDQECKPKESDCRPDREVRVELQGSELWKRFYEIGTEMIITKAGRRMFPSVRVKVRNLDPGQQYYIALDVMPVDSKRYRYVYHSSQWMVAGNTDHSCIAPRLYLHPDSPCAGETWMRQVISFDRVKLTNNEMDDKGHVILQSMHKYKPRVHVIRHDPRMDLSQIQSLPAEGVHSFSFPETEFTTVTAYQNQQITKLKIDRNPFAKGFRDPGRNRGVLDGLLESYPWRGPLSLDFKPFAIQLQGSSGPTSGSVKGLLPLHPFAALSCQDAAALHSLAFPLYGKSAGLSPAVSPLAARAFASSSSSSSSDRLRGLPALPPLTDLPLLSALQGKKLPLCRDGCPTAGAPGGPPCLIPLHGPLGPQGSALLPQLAEAAAAAAAGPYCLYRYSFPLSPPLAKLSEDGPSAADRLLRRSPWHPTTNHCL